MYKNLKQVILCGVCVTALAACETSATHEAEVDIPPSMMNAYLNDKPASLHRFYRNVPRQGDRNLVLNHARAGLAAFEAGNLTLAEKSFDDARLLIEAIYANNEDAKAARTTFVAENRKDFKGEPYERAMVYYYLGLIKMARGDYDSAAVAFRAGQYQDQVAIDAPEEDELYGDDFASLQYLEGWASKCAGYDDDAREDFQAAINKDVDELLRAPAKTDNTLFVVETGFAPKKVAEGDHAEILKFARDTRSQTVLASMQRLNSNGAAYQSFALPQAEDLVFQASSRGGRQVDAINAGKAQFKDNMDTAGKVTGAVGAGLAYAAAAGYASGNSDFGNAAGVAALGFLAASLITTAVADAAKPEADVRYWDNLPDQLHLGTAQQSHNALKNHMRQLEDSAAKMHAEAAKAEAAAMAGEDYQAESFSSVSPLFNVRFTPVGNEAHEGWSAEVVKVYASGQCAMVWAREHSAFSVADRAPNSFNGQVVAYTGPVPEDAAPAQPVFIAEQPTNDTADVVVERQQVEDAPAITESEYREDEKPVIAERERQIEAIDSEIAAVEAEPTPPVATETEMVTAPALAPATPSNSGAVTTSAPVEAASEPQRSNTSAFTPRGSRGRR